MTETNRLAKLVVWLLLAFAVVLPAAAALSVGTLTCEQLVNPQGIDAKAPRLSWQLQSNQPDTLQTAYQIIVASSLSKLKAGQADLWDSGQVSSDQSVLVAYAGKSLAAREACFWRVRVWDSHGQVSAWSPPARWTMGILNATEWHAKWIGLDSADHREYLTGAAWIWSANPDANTNVFRKVVTLPAHRPIKRAVFEYAGDGLCRGWLNQFDLGARKGLKMVKWNDITTRLEPGKTYVFGLTGTHDASAPHPAAVIGKLTLVYADGETQVIPTDASWKVSPAVADDWHAAHFDDAHWTSPTVLGPAGTSPWGAPQTAESRVQPARYLRKEFSVPKKILRATVSFCGLGLSELYLNGRKVGDAVLSPAFSQYNKRDYYVTYDVTKNLQPGQNALGVILGNGRFYADRSKVYTGTVNFGWPKLILNLRLEYADGTTAEIVSDDSWKITTNGPILANNDYDGEVYDARREMPGWSRPGFDDANWMPVQIVESPGGILSAQMIEPIRVTGTLKPVSMKEITPGVYICDLGQNIAGWCQVQVSGRAGTRLTLRHAETLKPDGSLNTANLRGAEATDVYILKGAGTETWEPRFVTHGFRYVEVTGLPANSLSHQPLFSLAGRIVNDDLPTTGSFLCSNDLLNQIYTNIVWGTRGNYRSIPTDCPQRDERQGWLGDRSEECKGEAYLFDTAPIYAKWRQDMADAQRANGVIPDIAPAFWPIYSDNVTWPSSALIIPDALQRQFGDAACIGKFYDGAKLWMNHMLNFATNYIISKDSYGDWCVPPENPLLIHSQDPARQTDKALLATSYYYYDLGLMEKFAAELGKTEDAAHWNALAAQFKTAFNEKFLNREQGQYSNGTQTSCVLPLAFGLVPDALKATVFAKLVDDIENKTKGHIGTGLIGGQYLNRVLSDNGRPDLAYTIATQTDYPSWGYMVKHGATTIWELWNGNTADPTMNSGNHVMLIGDLVLWFYEHLAGIAPDDARPGFKHIIMRPTPVGNLTFVKATHRSPYGLITSEWHCAGDQFAWRIEIPPNTTATVMIPKEKRARITCDGKPAGPTLELGSGKHHLISQ